MSAIVIGGSSTQSRGKRPGKPCCTTRCSGAYEWLEDGRRILSWPMGQFGPLLGYPSYTNSLTAELIDHLIGHMSTGKVSLGSYAPVLEQQLADKLASLYAPYLRSPDIGIRFFSNGTDACQAAVALARYATVREAFVSVGYHGGSSPVFAFKPQNKGVLYANAEARFDIPFEGMSLDAMEKTGEGIACAIVEVPSVENEHDAADGLYNIAHYYRQKGAYFILDDIVTGFRYAPAGALEYYSRMNYLPGQGAGRLVEWTRNIQADFICLGKALSTYGKVAALLGPVDVMQALTDEVFASFTYNDHPLGFADALWTLEQYEKHNAELYGGLSNDGIVHVGSKLKVELDHLFSKYSFPAKCIGRPSRSAIVPTNDYPETRNAIRQWQNFMVDDYDILLHQPQFATLSHTLEDVDKTLEATETVLQLMGYRNG